MASAFLAVLLAVTSYRAAAEGQALDLKLSSKASGIYTLRTALGLPPQNFSLMLSVSQKLTWVPTIDCGSCQQVRTTPYNRTASKSAFRPQGATRSVWNDNLTYLIDNDGVAQGKYEGDLVHLVDEDSTNEVIVTSRFGGLTAAPYVDFNNGFDGIIGLGTVDSPPSESVGDIFADSLIHTLTSTGKVPRAVVGVDLRGELGEVSDTAGTLTFGGVNTDLHHDDSMCFYPVVNRSEKLLLQSGWTVAMPSVKLNGQELDTSTTLSLNSASIFSYAPKAEVDKIARKLFALNAGGTYLVLANIKFNITFMLTDGVCQSNSTSSTREITLTEKDLVLKSTDENLGVLLIAPYETPLKVASDDRPNLASMVSGWTLGIPFMKKQYIALDQSLTTTAAVGFANKKSIEQHSALATPVRSQEGVVLV